jgi:FkbM family methyltransferase
MPIFRQSNVKMPPLTKNANCVSPPERRVAPQMVNVRGTQLYFACPDETAIYEPQVLDYIDRLERGSVFYDLGACVGYFSLYASAKCLDVYAFEIEAKNFAALQQNLSANEFSNVRAFQVGVSDGASQWADLRVGQDKAGGHHKTLVVDEFAGPANIVKEEYTIQRVRVGALDDLVREFQLPPPNHMKIDIDGSEVVFLRGARSVLANPELQSLIFELYEESPYYQAILEQLADHGFSVTAKHPINQPWPGCERLFNYELWK